VYPLDSLDDAALIRLSLAEAEQFELLFVRHEPAIRRYVARRLGVDAADDVVAETFLLAFRQRADYDSARGGVLAWLYGIATNLVQLPAPRHRRLGDRRPLGQAAGRRLERPRPVHGNGGTEAGLRLRYGQTPVNAGYDRSAAGADLVP
jgi:hypothetical protein